MTSLDVRAAIVFQLVEPERIAAGEPAVLEALIDRQLMIADASRYSVREPGDAEVERGVQAIRCAVWVATGVRDRRGGHRHDRRPSADLS